MLQLLLQPQKVQNNCEKKAPIWLPQRAQSKVTTLGAWGSQKRSSRLRNKDAATIDPSYKPKPITVSDDDFDKSAKPVAILKSKCIQLAVKESCIKTLLTQHADDVPHV